MFFYAAIILLANPVITEAAKPNTLIIPETVNNEAVSKSNREMEESFSSKLVNESEFTVPISNTTSASVAASTAEATSPVAILTIFADPGSSTTGSSGGDGTSNFGVHAFITVKNNSSSNIDVGKLTAIAPGKTVSLGTWGNKTEHKGLWYNLESYFVYKSAAYSGRVSISYGLNSTQLNTLNNFITNNDSWSKLSNCSTFASKAWNSIASTDYKVSAGVPNTPKKLANDIKSKWSFEYLTKAPVPWNYSVYYASGTGTPKLSATYK